MVDGSRSNKTTGRDPLTLSDHQLVLAGTGDGSGRMEVENWSLDPEKSSLKMEDNVIHIDDQFRLKIRTPKQQKTGTGLTVPNMILKKLLVEAEARGEAFADGEAERRANTLAENFYKKLECHRAFLCVKVLEHVCPQGLEGGCSLGPRAAFVSDVPILDNYSTFTNPLDVHLDKMHKM